MAAEGQSDKVVPDMEAWMKQRCVTEFLHAKEIVPIDINWCLQNICGYQIVDVSTVRWCVLAVVTATVSYLHLCKFFLHYWWKDIANGGDYVEKSAF